MNLEEKRLQEWTKGKAVIVLQRLFKILQKYSGETYKITEIPEAYQNKYGKFLGFYVVSSKGNVYRANFLLGVSSEEIVSIDRFDKSDNKLKVPVDTLSLEGFGISKIFNCILDWMRGLGKDMKESSETQEALHEAYDWTGAMVRFLDAYPDWVKQNSSGTLDPAKFRAAFNAFTKSDGNSDSISVSYTLKKFKTVLEKGLLGGGTKSGAVKVPVGAVFPGVPSKPAATNDDLMATYSGGDAKKFAAYLADLDSPNTSNPLGVIENYREYIVDMVEEPDNTSSGVIAWGKGGTGKSHHAEKALQSIGMREGAHYKIFSGKITGGSEALIALLYDCTNYQIAIIDDADNVFGPNYRTILLNALQSDAAKRKISITSPIRSFSGVMITEDFVIENTKFVFITNKNVAEMDAAFKSRLKSFNFDFTDGEMLQLIGDAFNTMLPDDPTLTKDIKVEVFTLLKASYDKNIVKRIDFRVMLDCLRAYSLASNRGRDPYKAVATTIKDIV